MPRIAVTLGDPRGIGPEVVGKALRDPRVRGRARFHLLGPEGFELSEEARADGVRREAVAPWRPGGDEAAAGRVSALAIERGIELALAEAVDGLVTAPVSKAALSAAGWDFPGHTELLRERTGVPEVAMLMAAERTPTGGPLRMALVTAHVPLRDVPRLLTVERVVERARLAVRALREWWGLDRPRICFAGVNPHASEGGLFGDEEARVLRPAARVLSGDGEAEVQGIHPADTVFRRCLEGRVDLVVVPYHDVGLAVLKTLARDTGVNITAGLPFPRTAPDHGTAFDIAGQGIADPSSTVAALELCLRFCARRAGRGADRPGAPAGPGAAAAAEVAE